MGISENLQLSCLLKRKRFTTGVQAATSVIYTPLNAKSISFSCDGTVLMDVEKYDIVVE